jgi:hypothetical protein
MRTSHHHSIPLSTFGRRLSSLLRTLKAPALPPPSLKSYINPISTSGTFPPSQPGACHHGRTRTRYHTYKTASTIESARAPSGKAIAPSHSGFWKHVRARASYHPYNTTFVTKSNCDTQPYSPPTYTIHFRTYTTTQRHVRTRIPYCSDPSPLYHHPVCHAPLPCLHVENNIQAHARRMTAQACSRSPRELQSVPPGPLFLWTGTSTQQTSLPPSNTRSGRTKVST